MAHFEIFASDVAAAKSFYAGLFGWEFAPLAGAEEAEYFRITGPLIGTGKGLTGGLMRRPDTAHPSGSAVRGATMTFEVDDCDAAFAWALANGGGEALPPADYPGMGRCAYVEDGFGNIVGLKTPEQVD